ncbi:hypothetical protein Pelo_631 [Pelomyxa schiedti]|nr:hypothetical protein Pelo_631 [Pelomyxa schiedti]
MIRALASRQQVARDTLKSDYGWTANGETSSGALAYKISSSSHDYRVVLHVTDTMMMIHHMPLRNVQEGNRTEVARVLNDWNDNLLAGNWEMDANDGQLLFRYGCIFDKTLSMPDFVGLFRENFEVCHSTWKGRSAQIVAFTQAGVGPEAFSDFSKERGLRLRDLPECRQQ